MAPETICNVAAVVYGIPTLSMLLTRRFAGDPLGRMMAAGFFGGFSLCFALAGWYFSILR